jgi:hypothetical protein
MSNPCLNRITQTVYGLRVHYRRLEQPIGAFVYEGRIEGRDLELWTEMGRWRDDGRPHEFDLAITLSHKGLTA